MPRVPRNKRGGENFTKAPTSGSSAVVHAFQDADGNTVAKVLADGTIIGIVDADTLDGIDSTQFARTDSYEIFDEDVDFSKSVNVTEEMETTDLEVLKRFQLAVDTGSVGGIDWADPAISFFSDNDDVTIGASSNIPLGGVHFLILNLTGSGALNYPAGWTWAGEPLPSTHTGGVFFVVLIAHDGDVDDSDVLAARFHTFEEALDYAVDSAVDSSAGAGDAGKLVKLDGSGLLDSSFVAEVLGFGDLSDGNAGISAAIGNLLIGGGTEFTSLSSAAFMASFNVESLANVSLTPAAGDLHLYSGSLWEPKSRREVFPIAQYVHLGSLSIGAGTDIDLDTEDYEDTGFTHSAGAAAIQVDFTGDIEGWCHFTGEISTSTRAWLKAHLAVDTGGGYSAVTAAENIAYIRSGGTNEGSSGFSFFLPVTSGDLIKFVGTDTAGVGDITVEDNKFLCKLRRVG